MLGSCIMAANCGGKGEEQVTIVTCCLGFAHNIHSLIYSLGTHCLYTHMQTHTLHTHSCTHIYTSCTHAHTHAYNAHAHIYTFYTHTHKHTPCICIHKHISSRTLHADASRNDYYTPTYACTCMHTPSSKLPGCAVQYEFCSPGSGHTSVCPRTPSTQSLLSGQ